MIDAQQRSQIGGRVASRGGAWSVRSGFTLIEIMVVVGIAAVLLTLAVPAFVRRLSPESMQRAVNDLTELLWRARADAILGGGITAVQIRPGEGVFQITKVVSQSPPSSDGLAEEGGVKAARVRPAIPADPASVKNDERHKTLHPSIKIEGLGINGEDWTEDQVAEVRFYPNGTCDELSIILLSEKMERRNIWLEVVTALSTVETDPSKFRAR